MARQTTLADVKKDKSHLQSTNQQTRAENRTSRIDQQESQGIFKESKFSSIPEEWEILPLKKLNSRKRITLNPNDFPDEVFEYYSIPAYQNSRKPVLEEGSNILSQKILLQDKAILFGRLNPRVKKVWKVHSHSRYRKICSTEFIPIFLDDSKIDLDYLYYIEWSEYVMAPAKRLVTGSTPSRQRIDPSSFYRIKIPLPPLPEQKEIATILSSVDDTIQKTQSIIGQIQKLKKGLMQELFTKGIGHTEFKKTEIGEMPEEWDALKLSEISKYIQYGYTAPTHKECIGTPIIAISDIKFESGKVNYEKLKHAEISVKERPKYLLKKGNLLIARTGAYSGKSHLVNEEKEVIFGSYLIRFSLDVSKVIPEFIHQFTFSSNYWNQILGFRRGAGQPNVNASQLKSIKLPLPPLSEQQKIANILSTIDKRIEEEQQYKSQLEKLKKGLMQDLLTGKVRVKVDK